MNAKDSGCGFRLKWLGCACFEMDFGGVTVVNDPWITPIKRTDLTWESVENCQYITVTHGHYDHILDIPALAKKFNPYVLCPENTAIALMKWADLNPMSVYPMKSGMELDLDAVKIKALFGRHTPLPGTVNERLESSKTHPIVGKDPYLSEMTFWGDFEYCNYLFTMPDGTKILFWGNPLSRPEQRNTLRAERPDILIIQTTSPSTPAYAAELCKELGCKVVIPHHSDFPGDYRPYAQKLGEELARLAPQTRCIIPQYGEWISL